MNLLHINWNSDSEEKSSSKKPKRIKKVRVQKRHTKKTILVTDPKTNQKLGIEQAIFLSGEEKPDPKLFYERSKKLHVSNGSPKTKCSIS